jgi:hypothetical protein
MRVQACLCSRQLHAQPARLLAVATDQFCIVIGDAHVVVMLYVLEEEGARELRCPSVPHRLRASVFLPPVRAGLLHLESQHVTLGKGPRNPRHRLRSACGQGVTIPRAQRKPLAPTAWQ